MKRHFTWPLVLWLAAAGGATASAANRNYVVVAAPRNPIVTNMQGKYRPDDAQLVNRVVMIATNSLSFDGSYVACDRATSTTRKVPVGRLIRQLIPDERKYERLNIAEPGEFGLKLAPPTMVAATRFRCLRAATRGGNWTDATMFPAGAGRWVLWMPSASDHLLILRPATGPIRASFDCRRARSASERAICSDRLLAGWDRSVAAAYDEGGGDAADQRAWLAERDRCGADKACLHESMSTRTGNLLR